jgi:DNA-directed RNA polymerase subunit RPC12/RpoP
MIIVCSQCGAKITTEKEKRFLTCPFCRSSLILEKDRTFACFYLQHKRNDQWARGALLARLSRAGYRETLGNIKIDFRYFPVWHITHTDGTTRTQPGAQTLHTEISSVRIPAGDLKYVEEHSSSGEKFPPPTIHPDAASLWTKDVGREMESIERLWLMYLPVYFMDFTLDGTYHRGSLVGETTTIYSDTLPSLQGKRTPAGLSIFFIAALGTFILLGSFISSVLIKGIAIGLAASIFIVGWKIRMRGET